MRIDDITRTSLLYDFYGQLLSERQRQVMEMYHEDNLSLAEIASEIGISRQGVYDALKNAERSLDRYEHKLKLVARLSGSMEAISEIDGIIDDVTALLLSENTPASNEAVKDLKKVRDIIDRLED